jgi:hypothetical protein
VDRVQRLPRRTPELQARTFLEDGTRLSAIDRARAEHRFRQAMAAGGTGEYAGRAGLALIGLRLKHLSDPADLHLIVDSLKTLAGRFPGTADEIGRFAAGVADVDSAAREVSTETPQGDLRLFLAAESARETLKAPAIAEALFRRIQEQWPFSPYAPKAVLAAQQLNPGWADSARALLDLQYYDSPYVATVQGEATPEYRQLEDSLGRYAASLVASRSAGVRRKPGRPVLPPGGRRPQPPPGGSKVPEPL